MKSDSPIKATREFASKGRNEGRHSYLSDGAIEYWTAKEEKRPRVNPFPLRGRRFREFQRGMWEAAHADDIMRRARDER